MIQCNSEIWDVTDKQISMYNDQLQLYLESTGYSDLPSPPRLMRRANRILNV